MNRPAADVVSIALLQVFGDNFDSEENDWNGMLCGEFTPGGEPPTSFYEREIQPIWNGIGTGTRACTQCHVGREPAAGLSLAAGVSHGNIVDEMSTLERMDLVTPGDHLESYLWHKINGSQSTVGGGGVQMPRGASPLSGADIDKVAAWIDAGADP